MSSGSTWQSHFEDQELQEVIQRDVLRTLPTLHFFSTPERVCSEHGRALIRVLFVYAKTNRSIRYVQGMNEVLAPLYVVFATTGAAAERAHAEADAFACFARLMGEIGDVFNKQLDDAMLDAFNPVGRYQALLARLDPQLHCALAAKGLDPRFYALRWLSLLFSQEFPLPAVERLWDALFADDERFTLLLFFACTLVIERRREILASDFSRALFLLQNLRVDDLEHTLAHAAQYMAFTPRECLDPRLMTQHMRQLSPHGNDLFEQDSHAFKSDTVCVSRLASLDVSLLDVCSHLFVCSLMCSKTTKTQKPMRQRERTPSTTSPKPHDDTTAAATTITTTTAHRETLPGSLPDEFCTLDWHDTHEDTHDESP